MSSLISAFGKGRQVAGEVIITGGCGNQVKGFLNGPFTEAMRRNVEDFMQSDGSGMVQYAFGRSINPNAGLKTTEIEKRQWTLNIVLIDLFGHGNPVENFRKLEGMVTYANMHFVMHEVGKPGSIKIGTNSQYWFKNNEVWVIEARGEWSPSVTTDGKPLYISAEVTLMEDKIKSCVQIVNGE